MNGMATIESYIEKSVKYISTRDAWCYGSPGLAYSLMYASKILNDSYLYEISCTSLKNSLIRKNEIFSPTFCHGYAGLAYISYKFNLLTKENIFLEESDKLLERIMSFYDQNNCFGFCNIEKIGNRIKKLNSISLLDGSIGVLLTILKSNKNNTIWDSIFLVD
ncbi:MAG: lanthionine synthetase LanC family protein [Clostridiales bacterium]